MRHQGNTLRTYRTKNFSVVLREFPEHDHPEGTIATGDEEADREYVRKIETGEYPWYCLVVEVYYRGHLIGADSLGWCDTYDLAHLGARWMVKEAIRQARSYLEEFQNAHSLLARSG